MSLNIFHEKAIYCNSPHIEKGRELSDRSGSSGYPSLGDTGVAVLQGRD